MANAGSVKWFDRKKGIGFGAPTLLFDHSSSPLPSLKVIDKQSPPAQRDGDEIAFLLSN